MRRIQRGPLAISLPPPTSAIWLGLSILIHLATYAGLMVLANRNAPERSSGLHLISGDEKDYKASAENLLIVGDYIVNTNDPSSRASRMPGYALTYLPFRILLGPDRGAGALVFAQIFFGGAAAYYAALVAFRLTFQPAAFWAGLTLGLMPSFPMVFNAYTVPDGLAASVALFAILSALTFDASGGNKFALVTGVFGIYLFFLRAFAAPILAFLAVFLWFAADHPLRASSRPPPKRSRRALALTAFLTPIVIAEASWVARNWLQLREFIPLQKAGFELAAPEKAVRRWSVSHGGDIVPWRPGTTGAWLQQELSLETDTADLPASATTPACGADRLLRARVLYRQWLRAIVNAKGEDLGARVVAEFDACRVAYESAHPFDHLVVARARLLKGFLIHAGPPLPLPPFRSMRTLSVGTALKILTASSYGLTIALGSVGLLLLVASGDRAALLIASIPIYFLLVFPFVLGYIETRYITTAYPFFLIAAAVTTSVLITRGPPALRRVKVAVLEPGA